MIEHALNSEKIQFARVDGGKSHEERKKAIQLFSKNEDCTVLLASIGSAGTGLVFSLIPDYPEYAISWLIYRAD